LSLATFVDAVDGDMEDVDQGKGQLKDAGIVYEKVDDS
jgi:hypothetical protein